MKSRTPVMQEESGNINTAEGMALEAWLFAVNSYPLLLNQHSKNT